MFGLPADWSLEVPERYFTLESYDGGVARWCPGCGDFAVLSAVQRICRDEQIPPEKLAMISGIGWVSELIEAAGGVDVFKHLSAKKSARDRIVPRDAVIAAQPDIIVGSWCGKKFVPAKVAARPGFGAVPAVRDGYLREIKSALILQPGPAALTDGVDALVAIIAEWAAKWA